MIAERLRAVAARNPEHLAIADGGERISYGELAWRIDRCRAWLSRRLEIAPGEVIAASLENSWEFIASFFAVVESGGIFLPVHPGWRERELRILNKRVNVRGVVTKSAAEWDRVISPARIADVAQGFGGVDDDAPLRPANETVLYLTTSGSTGVPRIVPRTHSNLVAGGRNVGRALGIDSSRRFLCVVPFHHSSGFHNSLIVPLLNGASLILMRQFTPAAFAKLAAAERADILIGSPFIYRMLLEHGEDLPTLKLCVSAGARMPDSLSASWEKRFGTRVRQLYGSTESSVISIERAPESAPPGTVGTPIDEVEIRVLNGEIAVRSPMVMAGYVGEDNRDRFENGFFRTGDLGCVDPDGRLRLNGRARRRINLAGVKVDPVEIERTIEMMDGVATCHVDSGDGENELVRARIELRAGMVMTRAEVIAHCRAQLAEYKLPRVIEFVEALPLTLAGKIAAPWAHTGRNGD